MKNISWGGYTADWGGSVMASIKRDRVWAPDPIEGYVLGYVTDFNGDALTIDLANSTGQVGCLWVELSDHV